MAGIEASTGHDTRITYLTIRTRYKRLCEPNVVCNSRLQIKIHAYMSLGCDVAGTCSQALVSASMTCHMYILRSWTHDILYKNKDDSTSSCKLALHH